MEKTDRRRLADVLGATLEIYGARLTDAAIGIWWTALQRYPLRDVEQALAAHIANPDSGHFAPKPSDVIRAIQSRDMRPDAEEAWAMLPKSEADTAIMTQEMLTAFGVCVNLIESGDMIAARMAFKESYEKAVRAAREAGAPVHWAPSLGWDVGGREAPLRQAVEHGRITAEHAQELLPAPLVIHPKVASLIIDAARQKRLK